MEIHSGSALSILMYYWPFILSGMASLFYYSRLSIGKLVLFFGIGVLAGEGVSAIMLMSISVLLMPLASVYLEHRAVATLVFAVLYAGSALITACVLWVLGKSLCGRARTSLHIPLDAPTIGAPVNAHSDSTGMSQIDFSITEQNYLHSLWLHHNLNTWRISGVIVVTILVGIFAHMAAKFSVSASAGGVIGYITWYLAYYFIVLRYRCEKLYRQQKSLHLPVKVIWSNETIKFISANSSTVLKWSDYVKHKENDKLFLLYQSDALFNLIPKSSFISPEQLRDFSLNLNRDR